MKISIGTTLFRQDQKYTLLIPIDEDIDKVALATLLSSHKVSGVDEVLENIKGKSGEFHLIYSDHQRFKRILLTGLGSNRVTAKAKTIFISTVAKHRDFIGEYIALDPNLLKLTSGNELLVEQSTCGIFIGVSATPLYKTVDATTTTIREIHILTENESLREAGLKGLSKGETISEIINLVNAPSNFKTVNHLAAWLKKSSEERDYTLQILEKKDLENHGFHALIAVNRGSEIPAKCMIANYRPKSSGELPKVCIVGKGVTFDTGGLSIKGRNNMHYMKSDMGGAAAAMGTIDLASKLQLPVDLTIVIPATDNSVDSLSIKPGDVISSYNGKSIEVIDTDAEGRLILADALSYAVRNCSPDYLIDLATLTGSVVAALGPEAAGIMSHNDELVKALTEAGDEVGERIWRLPLWKEYASYMESDIADIRNLGTKPYAGAITAGKFLESFVEDHHRWAHLDIAGTAFGNFPTTKAYSATGFGIDLLINWLTSISD